MSELRSQSAFKLLLYADHKKQSAKHKYQSGASYWATDIHVSSTCFSLELSTKRCGWAHGYHKLGKELIMIVKKRKTNQCVCALSFCRPMCNRGGRQVHGESRRERPRNVPSLRPLHNAQQGCRRWGLLHQGHHGDDHCESQLLTFWSGIG